MQRLPLMMIKYIERMCAEIKKRVQINREKLCKFCFSMLPEKGLSANAFAYRSTKTMMGPAHEKQPRQFTFLFEMYFRFGHHMQLSYIRPFNRNVSKFF